MGLLLLGVGAAIVESITTPAHAVHAPTPWLGDILIISGQAVQSAYVLLAQSLLRDYKIPPLQYAGFQGTVGVVFTSVLLLVAHYVPGDAVGGRLENSLDAIVQIAHSAHSVLPVILCGCVAVGALFTTATNYVTQWYGGTAWVLSVAFTTPVIISSSLLVAWEPVRAMCV